MHDEAGTRTALAPAPSRAVGSDPHDFAGLYVRHRSSFTSHARRYLRDPRDADEVVQEAFLRLFLALPELETELQALAYCRRTITNLCIDRYRSDARRPRLVALEGPTVDELAEDDTGDPVVRAEDAALVREALSRLPALHRAALVKREVEEKPLPVIADELDVAEDSVKHLLFRARRTLRKLLAGTSVAPGTDAERTRGLRPAASGASGGLAGLLVLVLVGLGSGPDLRAVPVVGVDLPDVLGVTAVVDAVSDAVNGAVQVLVPGERAEAASPPQEPGSRPGAQPTDGEAAAASEAVAGTTSTAARTAPRGSGAQAAAPQAAGQSMGAPQDRGVPTTVVTVVDGRPVVTVLPPAAAAPQAAAPSTGVRPAPGRGPSLPSRVPPVADGRASAPAVGAPTTPVLVAEPLTPPGGSTLPPVGPRAGDVHGGTGPVATRGAARAERAAGPPDWAAARGSSPADQPGRQPDTVAAKAADKAERAADRTAVVVEEKAADKAAEKAAAKAEKAAAKAERAAARAAAEQEQAAAAAAAAAAVAPTAAQVPTAVDPATTP